MVTGESSVQDNMNASLLMKQLGRPNSGLDLSGGGGVRPKRKSLNTNDLPFKKILKKSLQ